ncbi:hypothetical protein FB45DRAFT_1133864, partial [Roridomyces roridus]
VFGKHARIFRVDRSGYIFTEAFDWSRNRTVFPEFYWRLYNGAEDGRVLGDDTTLSELSGGERKELRVKLSKIMGYSSMNLDEATAMSRRVQVHVNGEMTSAFTFGEPIFQSTGLWGRGTRVDRVVIGDQVCVMKDAWRQKCRMPEHQFYEVIRDYIEENAGGEWPAGLSAWMGSLTLSDIHTDHQTITAALRPKGDSRLDRCHDRSVFSSVDTTLDNFESTQQLVKAIRDAIAGHEIAYNAGVLHRDVSAGNVLLLPKGGFLLDFDYSTLVDEGFARFQKLFPTEQEEEEMDKTSKDITGTYPFMSIASLTQLCEPDPESSFCHSTTDDLQGFYWLLLWVILRHTEHKHILGSGACASVFDGDVADVMRKKKTWVFKWVTSNRRHCIEITNNPPLTALVDELTNIVSDSISRKPIPATHESFLAAFDVALESTGWPVDDKALKFELPYIAEDKKFGMSFGVDVDVDADATMPPPSHPASAGLGDNVRPRASRSNSSRSLNQPNVDPLPIAGSPIASGSHVSTAGGSQGKRKREQSEDAHPTRRPSKMRAGASPAIPEEERGSQVEDAQMTRRSPRTRSRTSTAEETKGARRSKRLNPTT